MNRLRQRFEKEIKPQLATILGFGNLLAVPRVIKVVLNIGVGEATAQKEAIEQAQVQLTVIAGQKAIQTTARKSISSFKIRQGQPIGVTVTLRGDKAYAFLDKLFNIVLPRLRDFQGLAPKAFDGRGNYSIGLAEQTVFPEIDYSKIDKIRGLEITVVTNAGSDKGGSQLLRLLGLPFPKEVNG